MELLQEQCKGRKLARLFNPTSPTTSLGYQSALIEVVFPGEVLVNSELVLNNSFPVPATGIPTITFHDPLPATAANALPIRAWPECGE